MSLFKKIVKGAGKVLGSIAKPALALAGELGVPGVGLVSKLIPDAPAKAQLAAASQLTWAAEAPATSKVDAISKAVEAAAQVRLNGGTETQASQVAAAVQSLAASPPAVAAQTVVQADEELAASTAKSSPVASALAIQPITSNTPTLTNSLTAQDIKTVLQGAVEGAKSGALDTYLDKTEDGKEAKKEAVDAAGSKILPYVLGAGLLLMMFNRK